MARAAPAEPPPAGRAGTRPPRRGRPRDRTLPARRREEILHAATAMFSGQGYAGADVQCIADRLGVAKGTLYRYFPSKRALFLAAVDRGMRLLGESVDGAVAAHDSPLDGVRAAVGAYLRFFRDNPELCELIVLERAEFRDRRTPTYFRYRAANRERWGRYYQGLMDGGIIRPMPVERILSVLGDLVYGTMFTNFFSRRDRSPEEQARDILDVVFRGILTPQGARAWGGAAPEAP